MKYVARGWESKDVEAQQEAVFSERPVGVRLTIEQAARVRERGALSLTRTLLAKQISEATNTRYRDMLLRSLAEVDSKIEKLS